MSLIQQIAFLLIGAAALLALFRLFAGPGVHDRLVAADTLGVMTTGALVWFAASVERAIYLDVALLYGALAFVGVVAVARALEGRGT